MEKPEILKMSRSFDANAGKIRAEKPEKKNIFLKPKTFFDYWFFVEYKSFITTIFENPRVSRKASSKMALIFRKLVKNYSGYFNNLKVCTPKLEKMGLPTFEQETPENPKKHSSNK